MAVSSHSLHAALAGRARTTVRLTSENDLVGAVHLELVDGHGHPARGVSLSPASLALQAGEATSASVDIRLASAVPTGTFDFELVATAFVPGPEAGLVPTTHGTAIHLAVTGRGSGGFAPASGSPFAVGSAPASVAVADVDGNGTADLAVADSGSNGVSVLLGAGDGSFAAALASPLAAGSKPSSLVATDLNGDGRPDLAVADRGSDSLSVLPGRGNGSFAGAAVVRAGADPASLAAADLDGARRLGRDAAPDLAIVDGGAYGTVTVLLNDGTKGFAAARGSPFAAGNDPRSIAVGDLDGDGSPDLVVADHGGQVAVLLGDGYGGFDSRPPFRVGFGDRPVAVALADVNGDGRLDLMVLSAGSDDLSVMLGDGMGGFEATAASPIAVPDAPSSMAVGDFNADGRPDLAITAGTTSGSVSVLQGDGSGGFTPATGSPYVVGSAPSSVTVGDFNGDGALDLATANEGSNDVSVLLGR